MDEGWWFSAKEAELVIEDHRIGSLELSKDEISAVCILRWDLVGISLFAATWAIPQADLTSQNKLVPCK
jgi:hypothetical protein